MRISLIELMSLMFMLMKTSSGLPAAATRLSFNYQSQYLHHRTERQQLDIRVNYHATDRQTFHCWHHLMERSRIFHSWFSMKPYVPVVRKYVSYVDCWTNKTKTWIRTFCREYCVLNLLHKPDQKSNEAEKRLFILFFCIFMSISAYYTSAL